MAVYSAVTSEKISTNSVFISGPAGYHGPEHAPEAPTTTHGGRLACASRTLGSWKPFDKGPLRAAKENAVANTRRSLRLFFAVKFNWQMRVRTR